MERHQTVKIELTWQQCALIMLGLFDLKIEGSRVWNESSVIELRNQLVREILDMFGDGDTDHRDAVIL